MDIAGAAAALVDGGCPGAVVGVRTETLDAAAVGTADIASSEPMTVEHRFRIGSTTKTYVATLALLLAGEGALDLDERGVVPADPRITLRHLLSHRSGLADYMDGEGIAAARLADPLRRAHPRRDVAEAMAMPRVFEPGEGVAYSNTNYQAAGAVIEDVAGAPLHALVRSRLLEPLGLARTTFALEGRTEDGLCSGYAFTDGWYPVPDDLHYTVRRHAAVRTDDYVYAQLIPYIGNKRKLLPLVARGLAATGGGGGAPASGAGASRAAERTLVDLFSGSTVVYFSSSSVTSHCRPSCSAATAVVHVPANGSNTT